MFLVQPPSGGCVLKLKTSKRGLGVTYAAAFGRLCVETALIWLLRWYFLAAAFGRLCVETIRSFINRGMPDAAAFGRLCVETADLNLFKF